MNTCETPSWAGLLQIRGGFDHFARRLSQYIDIGDIISISKTCRRLRSNYDDLKVTAWNLDQRLKSHVEDPVAFRTKMQETNAVISGGFAMAFFDRQDSRDIGLDVYVHSHDHQDLWEDHLTTLEGYEHLPTWYCPWEPDSDADALKVFAKKLLADGERVVQMRNCTTDLRFHRWNVNEADERMFGETDMAQGHCIQIHVLTENIPLYRLIRHCTLTSLANVITWDHAYCLFPAETFLKRRSWNLSDSGANRETGHVWYKHKERSGLQIRIGPVTEDEKTSLTSLRGMRTFEDSHTWRMSLPTDMIPIQQSCLTHRHMALHSFAVATTTTCHELAEHQHPWGEWKLHKRADSRFMIYTVPFRSLALQHEYLIPNLTFKQTGNHRFGGNNISLSVQFYPNPVAAPFKYITGIADIVLEQLMWQARSQFSKRIRMSLKKALGAKHGAHLAVKDEPFPRAIKNSHGWEPSDGWVYHDDDMLDWYEMWRRGELTKERVPLWPASMAQLWQVRLEYSLAMVQDFWPGEGGDMSNEEVIQSRRISLEWDRWDGSEA